MNELKNIKLIVLDIDGTLVGDDKTVNNTVKDACYRAQENQIMLVIASGRVLSAAKTISDQVIKPNCRAYIIANNGSELYSYEKNKIIKSHHFKTDEVIHIFAICKRLPIIFLIFAPDKKCFYHNCKDLSKPFFSKITQHYKRFYNIEPMFLTNEDQTRIIKHKIPKIMLFFDSKNENLDKDVCDTLGQLNGVANCFHTFKRIIEINPLGISKATGIKELESLLKVSKDNIAAIGDAANDIEMLKHVKYSVAMGQASSQVKSVSYYVTDTVYNNGAATFINKVIQSKLKH